MTDMSLEEDRKLRLRVLQGSLDGFRKAYLRRAKTGERAAYIEALGALGMVLLWLEEPLNLSDEDPAFMWFVDLIRHLEDLDTGIVPPVFCPGQTGRKGLSTAEWMGRVWAVHAIELLHAVGVKYPAAAKRCGSETANGPLHLKHLRSNGAGRVPPPGLARQRHRCRLGRGRDRHLHRQPHCHA